MSPQRPACSACGCSPMGAKDGDECLRCSGEMTTAGATPRQDVDEQLAEALLVLDPHPAMDGRIRRLLAKGDAVAVSWLLKRIAELGR